MKVASRVLAAVGALLLAGCSSSTGHAAAAGRISVVAAELQYGDVAAQVGGRYVQVTSVEKDPAADPHSYEASPSVAREVESASVLIQNGLGYDSYMGKLEGASGGVKGRVVVDVSRLLGRPPGTFNPHLWYDPATMPAVARDLAAVFGRLQPAHAAQFQANAAAFDRALDPWRQALKQVAAGRSPAPAVAGTEPVADYLIAAAGLDELAPESFRAAVMDGTDPSPQDVTAMRTLLHTRRVKALVYNEQVTDSLTEALVKEAHSDGVPVVGVYETLPVGEHYQAWMVATTAALAAAVNAPAAP